MTCAFQTNETELMCMLLPMCFSCQWSSVVTEGVGGCHGAVRAVVTVAVNGSSRALTGTVIVV